MKYIRIAFLLIAVNYIMLFYHYFAAGFFSKIDYIKIVQALEYSFRSDTKLGKNSSEGNGSEVNDPYYYLQWAVSNINDDGVWRMIKQKREVRVAVVDTGVDYNHPDLKNRVLKNLGYNFYDNNNDSMDESGHGTHIAGIIAAEANNNIGITGIVGGLDIKIIPIKVLNKSGQGASDVIAEGMKYAVDQGADIINLSINFNKQDKYIQNALSYARSKGVFVVVSAGNDNISCDLLSPAGDNGAYTVAAVDSYDNKAYFSNYGRSVKISAPGTNIFSTTINEKYENRSGTSMAAPFVTAISAMMKAENPSITPERIEQILNETADKKHNFYGMGYGTVDAKKAIEKLINDEIYHN